MFETTKWVVRPYDFKTNDWCMVAYFLDMRDDRQSFDTVIRPEKKVTIHSHTRNLEKNYS